MNNYRKTTCILLKTVALILDDDVERFIEHLDLESKISQFLGTPSTLKVQKD